MVELQGLNGIPEPKPLRTDKVRNDREAAAARAKSSMAGEATSKDGVSISEEAQTAAEAGRILQASKTMDDIRAERVEQAKQRIASGEYKNRDVVSKVAERIMRVIG